MSRLLRAFFLSLVCSGTLCISQASPERILVSETVMRSLRTDTISPAYPRSALKAGLQGDVVLLLLINQAGEVEEVKLTSGQPLLARAAIEAVKHWKYKPYFFNGKPFAVSTTARLAFTISEDATGTVAEVPGGMVGLVDSPPGTPRPPVPRRIRVSEEVERALLQTSVDPKYPPDAKTQRIQGDVILKVIIDKAGNVQNVELVSGHPLLASAAIAAVKQQKYKPYLLNEIPVETETKLRVNFSLTR